MLSHGKDWGKAVKKLSFRGKTGEAEGLFSGDSSLTGGFLAFTICIRAKLKNFGDVFHWPQAGTDRSDFGLRLFYLKGQDP